MEQLNSLELQLTSHIHFRRGWLLDILITECLFGSFPGTEEQSAPKGIARSFEESF